MCESGIFVGGSLHLCQETRKKSKVYKKVQGLNRKTARPSSSFGQERTRRGRRPVRPNRQRSGGQGARVRLGTERGGREGLEDVLSTGGDRQEAPNLEEGRRRNWQPAEAVSMRGSALVFGWRRGLAEEMRLGVTDFMAASTSSPSAPVRRLTKRPAAALCRGGARCGAGELGFAGLGAHAI
jgi:hypothetical protein